MADPLLRLYGAAECGPDGYPLAWHSSTAYGVYSAGHSLANPAIKDLIRLQAGHRCLRCGHPYRKGEHGNGEWSPCDERCTHGAPLGWTNIEGVEPVQASDVTEALTVLAWLVETGRIRQSEPAKLVAQWRILTVHHLDEDKANCRWWNLAALCQRCHLTVQGRVKLQQLYVHPHSEWFKPYAAGYYASTYLSEELTRDETIARLDDLLALELDPSYRA